METLIINTILALMLIAYLVYGFILLSKIWWAFGLPPKPFWKRVKYHLSTWSVILFWPGWFFWIMYSK